MFWEFNSEIFMTRFGSVAQCKSIVGKKIQTSHHHNVVTSLNQLNQLNDAHPSITANTHDFEVGLKVIKWLDLDI